MNAKLQAIDEEVWALQPAVLRQIRAFLAGDATARAAIATSPAPARNQGVVAVIPIRGVLDRRSSWLSELFGGSSVESIRGALRAALADGEVKGIILDIDSPGGAVAGITELAEELRAARDQKPIVAVADTTAASAAYWLGAQASRFLVTRSGQVGSVGIFGIHMDVSRALDAEGITATVVSAGEHKADELGYTPLTDEAHAAIQARVDANYNQFVGDVAKGRGVSVETVKADYGQGAIVMAQDALDAGMVDAIGGVESAFREVTRLARQMAAEATVVELAASDEPHPFRERVAGLQADAEAVAEHARGRIALREKEGRPGLSDPILASLRATRDAISALLPPDEPAAAPTPTPAVEPPQIVPAAASSAPAIPRFRSTDEWMQFLETH